MKKNLIITIIGIISFFILFILLRFYFTEEAQNKLNRKITTALGVSNGVVEYYSGGKLLYRFMNVEKLSTAYGTDDSKPRPYRYGYGYIDLNNDKRIDESEKKKGKKYFEIPEFGTYIYYQF